MLDPATLRAIAAARLVDAEILLLNSRYDCALYICGYAIELTLKARICDTLNWSSYPETAKDFQGLQSFKVHNFDTLLRLSGRAKFIQQSAYLVDWSIVGKWNPEARYGTLGGVSQIDAQDFLRSTRILLSIL